MKKFRLVVWGLVGLLLVLAAILWGVRNIIVCWDGIEVNEPLLIEQCGITAEEYYSGDLVGAAGCPEESGAVQFVGSCDPEWGIIAVIAVGVALVYIFLSALFVGVRKLVRKS
jgi:hypothetical protein